MKAATVLFFAALPVLALDVQGNRITMSPEEMALCTAKKGCTLVTNEPLNEMRAAIESLLVMLDRRPVSCRKGEFI